MFANQRFPFQAPTNLTKDDKNVDDDENREKNGISDAKTGNAEKTDADKRPSKDETPLQK